MIAFEPVKGGARSRDDELAWLFNLMVLQHGDAATTRRKLESQLTSRIAQIDRDCKLSDDQKKKLVVAGQGDVKRAFARLDELKEKFEATAANAVERRQFLHEVARFRPASTTLDFFGDESLFAKVLKNTLSPEQLAVREKSIRDAAKARHQLAIHWAARSLEIWLKLSQEQRQQLEKLLIARTRAPRKFGEYDYYGLMFQLSKLPEQELEPILNREQRKNIQQHFAQAQRLEKILKDGGFLPEEDVASAGGAQRNQPVSEPVRSRSETHERGSI